MKKTLIVLATVLMFAILMVGCVVLGDRILADQMISKYSDDQNYVELSGTVVECDEDWLVIRCDELIKYIPYQTGDCPYEIYSTEPISLDVGDEIRFVTVPFHFYNGHDLPIVELTKDGVTLLEFEEGKENLLNWVQETFG